MRPNWTRVLIATAVTTALLAGCGKSSSQAPATDVSPAQASTPAPSAPAAGSAAPAKAPEEAAITQLILARKNDDAIVVAFEATKQRPKDAEAHFWLGVSYYAKGNLDGAIQAYQKTIELQKDHAMALNNLGNSFRDKGNYAVAEEWYRKAMTANPQFSVPVQQLALMLEGRGKVTDAIKVLQEGAQRIPTSADILFNLGLMFEQNEQKDMAKEAYTKALQLSPNLEDAKARLAAISK